MDNDHEVLNEVRAPTAITEFAADLGAGSRRF